MTTRTPYERYFRINATRLKTASVERLLQKEGFKFEQLPALSQGRRLLKEPFPLGRSLAAYFGYIYIQDLSSMIPPLILQPEPAEIVLDMCASPGSKTGMLARMTGPTGMVIANEPTPSRLQTMRTNLLRQNIFNVISTSYPGQNLALDRESLSSILLDVPCSGWGTVQKNPLATKVWTEEKTRSLVAVQRQLLSKAARLLAPGGRLVYSTCTTNKKENQDQIDWAVANLGLKSIPFSMPAGIVQENDASLRPDVQIDGAASKAQGFFIALLTKTGDISETTGYQSRVKVRPLSDFDFGTADPKGLGSGAVFTAKNRAFFVPAQALQSVSPELKWKGTAIGTVRNQKISIDNRIRSMIPDTGSCQRLSVSDPEDIKSLLQGQSINHTSSSKTLPLFWEDLPLGWIKCQNRRCFWANR